MNDIQLTLAERESPLWKKIEKYLDARIDQHRRKNDNDLDDLKTATLRGEIRECKALLSLGMERPEFGKPKGSQ